MARRWYVWPRGRRGHFRIAAVLAACLVGGMVSPAFAADGNIDHVESKDGALKILYSLPDLGNVDPDLRSLSVSLDGTKLTASATLASDAAAGTVRRTTILAMDVSNSMQRNGKFDEAKRAARLFLESAPSDVYVGIVTFAGSVQVAQQPSLDRAASKSVIDGLRLSLGTHLYDGITQSVKTSGTEGQRSVLVLSDGRDTSKTSLDEVSRTVQDAAVKVDVVALAQSEADEALLQQVSDAGNGEIFRASDPKGLSQLFTDEAQTLAKQILVTVQAPTGVARSEGTLSISVQAGNETYKDSAFVTVKSASSASETLQSTSLTTVPERGLHIGSNLMLGGLIAAGLGLLTLLLAALGVFRTTPDSVENHIAAYTRKGRRKPAEGHNPSAATGMAAQAIGVAEKALGNSREIESGLHDRLEAAGMSMKPAEWVLLHAGIAVGSAAVGFLVSSGGLLLMLTGLLLGAIIPWTYLRMKRAKRLKAFNGQLAETLQMMAGSLQAGLSMAQGIDTVVREGAEPLAGEFRRALVEARLGVQIEDALDSVAARMESPDFRWTVMAIRIQREVGGNLAELLLNVAGTLRERDYLRRQVKSLSAEGRFSAYILLALPPGVLLYMMLTNPTYLHPLISTPIGFAMLGGMGILMVLGTVSMKKLTSLEI